MVTKTTAAEAAGANDDEGEPLDLGALAPRLRKTRRETIVGGAVVALAGASFGVGSWSVTGELKSLNGKVEKLELSVSSRLERLEERVNNQAKLEGVIAEHDKRLREDATEIATLKAQIQSLHERK